MDDPAFDNVPALQPPAGIESNFVNPASEAYMAGAVEMVLLILATMATFARLYTKLRVVRKFDPEDCTVKTYSLSQTSLTSGCRSRGHCLGSPKTFAARDLAPNLVLGWICSVRSLRLCEPQYFGTAPVGRQHAADVLLPLGENDRAIDFMI